MFKYILIGNPIKLQNN